MSLKNQAKKVQKAGHKNTPQDSVLAHINPDEARLLKALGGSGRKDPKTGLRHFDGWGGDGGGGDAGAGGSGDGGNSGSSGWGGEPGGDRGDGGIGMGDGYGGDAGSYGDSLSFEGSFTPDNSFTSGEGAMGMGDFNSSFGDYGAAHGDINTYGESPEGPGNSDFFSRLARFTKNLAVNKAIGAVTQSNPVLGMMAPMAMTAINAHNQTPVGQQVAGSIAQAMLGPLGAIPGIANMFGANIPSIGQSIGQANLDYKGEAPGTTGLSGQNQGQGQGGTSMFDSVLNGAATGYGLYNMYKAGQQNNDQANSLANMFSQNSPYATQLRQQLARRDAAAGRRSQYGPREVELQAKLAQMAGQMAPHQMAARNAGNQNMMQMLGMLTSANKMGVFDPVKNYLGGMFSSNSTPEYTSSGDTYDAYDFGG
jgi:hypothetical protein